MKITIRTGNAAFESENKGPELARILREIADRTEREGQPRRGDSWAIFDANGNRVGKVTA